VIVDDITAPSAPVLSPLSGECSVTASVPSATDNCAGTVNGTTTDAVTYTTEGTYTIHWLFDDGNGNVSTADQTVTIDDVTAPAAPALETVTGECSASVSAPVAEDNCAGSVTGTTSDATTYSTQGTYTIHWSFDDGNGNTSTAVQTVIVQDVTAPSITCAADAEAVAESGVCSVHITPAAPAATDNCTVVSVLNDHPSDIYPVGVTVVTWTVTDGNNNTATCTQTVTVTDAEAPSVSCSGNVVVNNDPGVCSAQVTLTTPATGDNCGVLSVTNDHPTTTFPVGTTSVIWTVTDIHGNTSSCEQTVIVTDNEAPVILCGPNVTVATDTTKPYATLALRAPSASDNCDIATLTSNHPTPRYPIGTTIVTWTATDIHGNTATCTQTVTVNDIEGPSILCGAGVTAENTPGACEATVTLMIPDARDNSGKVNLTVNYPGIVILLLLRIILLLVQQFLLTSL
jgi:hypothetical protein